MSYCNFQQKSLKTIRLSVPICVTFCRRISIKSNLSYIILYDKIINKYIFKRYYGTIFSWKQPKLHLLFTHKKKKSFSIIKCSITPAQMILFRFPNVIKHIACADLERVRGSENSNLLNFLNSQSKVTEFIPLQTTSGSVHASRVILIDTFCQTIIPFVKFVLY